MRKTLAIGLVLIGMTSVACGQSEPSATVSIATLRVPAEARAHFERAQKAAVAGRTDEYEREIRRALELDRDFAEAYVLRGSQEVLRRDFQAALTDSYVAERLDRGVVFVRLVRASALNGLRRFSEALGVLDLVNQRESHTWEFAFEKTRAFVGLGDAAAALRWSAETLAGAPADSLDSARVLRGDALDLAGRYGEAAVAWREYLASPRVQVYRSQVLAALAKAERLSATQEVAGLRR
jgi:tetratricopeptide (TPR) repeat protein